MYLLQKYGRKFWNLTFCAAARTSRVTAAKVFPFSVMTNVGEERKMKKIFVFSAALLVLAACAQKEPFTEIQDPVQPQDQPQVEDQIV